jgi:hypothetical protein
MDGGGAGGGAGGGGGGGDEQAARMRVTNENAVIVRARLLIMIVFPKSGDIYSEFRTVSTSSCFLQ